MDEWGDGDCFLPFVFPPFEYSIWPGRRAYIAVRFPSSFESIKQAIRTENTSARTSEFYTIYTISRLFDREVPDARSRIHPLPKIPATIRFKVYSWFLLNHHRYRYG